MSEAPISPPVVRTFRPEYLPAYLSNGVIGLRVPRLAVLDGVSIVNGFVGIDSETGGEGFARSPYPVGGDLVVDAARLGELPERARFLSQRYDFSCGELTTRFRFDAGTAVADVEVVTFCSRSLPSIVLQETRVQVDRPCTVSLVARIAVDSVPGRLASRGTQTASWRDDHADGHLCWASAGDLDQCGVAHATELRGADAERSLDEDPAHPPATSYRFRARAGRSYRLRQLAASVPGTMHAQPEQQAVRLVHGAQLRGFERLREENRAAWRELWGGRVTLAGAPARWQGLADAAFFYTHTSVHTSSPASTSLFGLAYWPDYHYYRGHVMWDIDTFVVPPFVLLQPELARTLLDYRCERLPGARRNAQQQGYRGAQFPWESSPRTGEEAAPWDGSASTHEHHVSLDVAWAIGQYLAATHDWEWARERAWPVLRDVCDWIVSRGSWTRRGFELRAVNGIAERSTPVDNNAFVNMAAFLALRRSAQVGRRLGRAVPTAWERAADELYLPLNRRTSVVRNHDRYRRNEEKGETPEALAGMFPLGYRPAARVERATLAFYLDLADRYAGSPMMSASLGVFAAWAGDRRRSLELFERGYADFVLEPFTVTAEYGPSAFPEMTRAAPFAANTGGFLTSCLYGLTGISLDLEQGTEGWCTRPVVLPKGWDAIEVERIWVRGRPARVRALQGAPRADVELVG